jgi:hypothetical protein
LLAWLLSWKRRTAAGGTDPERRRRSIPLSDGIFEHFFALHQQGSRANPLTRRRKLKFEANAADLENGPLLRADYKGGMSAIPSIAAISAAASSHRVDAFLHNVANGSASSLLPTPPVPGTAPATTAAPAPTVVPAPNAAALSNLVRTHHVDAVGAPLVTTAGSDAAQPAPSVELQFDPRSPYGPTNGVAPSADLASEMIQQLVAYYPFTANGQIHPDTTQTVDIKT